MTLANEEKLLRRWVEQQQRPVGRGHSYTPALRRRIVEFVRIAKEAGMNERDCCAAIGVSRQSLAKWRREEDAAPTASEPPFDVPLELSTEPLSKELVPIEVTPSPIQLGAGLSLVSPRGFRVEGLSLEQAFALLREFL